MAAGLRIANPDDIAALKSRDRGPMLPIGSAHDHGATSHRSVCDRATWPSIDKCDMAKYLHARAGR